MVISMSTSEICFEILDIETLRPSSFSIPLSDITLDEATMSQSPKQTLLIDDDKNQLVLVRTGYCKAHCTVSVIRICCELGRVVSTQVALRDFTMTESSKNPKSVRHWHSISNSTECTIAFMPYGGDSLSCHYSLLDDSLSWATWDVYRLKQDLGDKFRLSTSAKNAACHGTTTFMLVISVPTRGTHISNELVVNRDTPYQRYDYGNDRNQGGRGVWRRCSVPAELLKNVAVDDILEMLFDGRFLIFATGASILVFEVPDYDSYMSTTKKAK